MTKENLKCIYCFFDSKYQRLLKQKTYKIDRFEEKLVKYKELYLTELQLICSVEKCSCCLASSNPQVKKWINDLCNNLVDNLPVIEETFEELIDIYLSFISLGQKEAHDKMWSFLEQNELINGATSLIGYTKLLFRGRAKKKGADSFSEIDFFHIPFSKRNKISNQRFSISGKPLLYLGYSVACVEQELGKNLNNISLSAFLPKYSCFYGNKVFELKNTFLSIIKDLPSLASGGCELDYYFEGIVPNYNTIVKDLQMLILFEVLMFPVESKDTFIEEYVLPQMLTELLRKHDYIGVTYPSTKEYNISGEHLYSDYNQNISFFTTYAKESDWDQHLKNCFHIIMLDGAEKYNFTTEDILSKIELVIKKPRCPKNYNDFIIPLTKTLSHIEYLQHSKLNNIPYFKTDGGRLELKFYFKLALLMDKLMDEFSEATL